MSPVARLFAREWLAVVACLAIGIALGAINVARMFPWTIAIDGVIAGWGSVVVQGVAVFAPLCYGLRVIVLVTAWAIRTRRAGRS